MISVENDKIFAITSYCDTKKKCDVLLQNIGLIRKMFPDFKIALHANYPLEYDIQKLVDKYFYEDLNHTAEDKWIYYWGIIINEKTNQPYFNKKFYYSIIDTGFSVFQQIKALSFYLINYKQVILINYDTSVEEIRIEDYNIDYDLILHYFPDHKAASLIAMSFNPLIFYNKLARWFTFENWMKVKRTDQLNEERFFDMINESGIRYYAYDYKISDKISNEPDFKNPNAPVNEFFESYLLYYENNKLEIYLWDLKCDISTISISLNEKEFIVNNKNIMGGFDNELICFEEDINNIIITSINEIPTSIKLKIKKGYSTRNIE